MDSPTHSLRGTLQYGTKFFWKIHRFSKLSESFQTVKTKKIFLRETCINKWKLVLEFRSSIMNLGLQYCAKFSHKVTVIASFTVRNSNNTVFAKRTLRESFTSGGELKFCDDYIREPSKLLTTTGDQDIKFRLCRDDVLIIEGNIISNCCLPNRSDTAECLQSLRSSFIKNEFSDVQFEIGEENVAAHKVILTSKSPVFKRMFETKMKESLENRIKLTDIDMTALKAFLTFLYTGIIENFKMSVILQLLYLGRIYDLPSLEEKCLDLVYFEMSLDNVYEVMLFATKQQHHLYNSACHIFCTYFKNIEKTLQWQKFKETNTIFAEIIEEVALSEIAKTNEEVALSEIAKTNEEVALSEIAKTNEEVALSEIAKTNEGD